MIRVILVVIALLACAYATYTDFKFRYINDWLSWGLVGVGIGGHALISLIEWSITPLLYSIGGAAIFFGISAVRYYVGEFGGGDAKLFTGIAAAVPIYPFVLKSTLASWPFLATLFVNVFIIGMVYQISYSAIKAALNFKRFKPAFSKEFSKIRKLAYVVIALLIVPIALLFYQVELAITVAVLIVLMILAALIVPFFKAVDEIMIYSAKPSELEAGDRPVNKIKVMGKLLYKPGRIGMLEEDVRRLQALEKLGKIGKIRVRDGIPYAPAILLGLLFSLILGDLLVILINSLAA